jgi:uncharacterized protein (TIGR02145 family)
VAENAVSTKQVVTFTALPGGYRNIDGSFDRVGAAGYWRCSTQYNTSNAWVKVLYYPNSGIFGQTGSKGNGFSVRCVRD